MEKAFQRLQQKGQYVGGEGTKRIGVGAEDADDDDDDDDDDDREDVRLPAAEFTAWRADLTNLNPDEAPDCLSCSVTMELFQEPVRAADGKVYERSMMVEFIQKKVDIFCAFVRRYVYSG